MNLNSEEKITTEEPKVVKAKPGRKPGRKPQGESKVESANKLLVAQVDALTSRCAVYKERGAKLLEENEMLKKEIDNLHIEKEINRTLFKNWAEAHKKNYEYYRLLNSLEKRLPWISRKLLRRLRLHLEL